MNCGRTLYFRRERNFSIFTKMRVSAVDCVKSEWAFCSLDNNPNEAPVRRGTLHLASFVRAEASNLVPYYPSTTYWINFFKYSNPWPSDCESHPTTTRPGFPPKCAAIFLSMKMFHLKREILIKIFLIKVSREKICQIRQRWQRRRRRREPNNQCDQMAILFFNIWPCTGIERQPEHIPILPK